MDADLTKITKVEKEFKGFLGLDESTMLSTKIINNLKRFVDAEIVKSAIDKIKSKRFKEAIHEIIELKKWVDDLPILDTLVDKAITDILRVAKADNLIGQTVLAIDDII